MPEYLAPGVFIEEVSTGPVPIAGVSTSTAAVIGLTPRGPIDAPTLVTSVGAFRELFGGAIPQDAGAALPAGFSAVWHAVQGFFENGGTRLYASRVDAGTGTARSEVYALPNSGGDTIEVHAIDTGKWAEPVFAVRNGRYQQVEGLRVSFAAEKVAPLSVVPMPGGGTANSASFVNVASSTGLYVGAVVQWMQAPGPNPDLAVVAGLTDATVGLAAGANFSGVPAVGDTMELVEFAMTIDYFENGRIAQSETWHNLNVNSGAQHFAESVIGSVALGRQGGASNLVRVTVTGPPDFVTHTPVGPPPGAAPTATTAGVDGFPANAAALAQLVLGADDDDPAQRTGIYAFKNIRGLLMIAMPGLTDTATQAELLALCENEKYKFAVLDPAPATTPDDWHTLDASPADVIAQRGNYDSEYGALYYPWLVVPDPFPEDPLNVRDVRLAPSGHVMGIYARSDIERGVHKAPANEIVNGVIAFSHHVDQGTQEILNPLGIDVLRDFRYANRGLRLWGARTISSNQDWKYVNIRRLFQYIEASIEYGTQWVVFEPNNELLWARVRQSVSNFLADTWRTGALMGTKASEAFYVHCDRTTMTQSDIENGRLIIEIGIAPTFPAEFVIFRISQWSASAQGS
jgi:hypothetical protein